MGTSDLPDLPDQGKDQKPVAPPPKPAAPNDGMDKGPIRKPPNK